MYTQKVEGTVADPFGLLLLIGGGAASQAMNLTKPTHRRWQGQEVAVPLCRLSGVAAFQQPRKILKS